jgi:hypothetical protein
VSSEEEEMGNTAQNNPCGVQSGKPASPFLLETDVTVSLGLRKALYVICLSSAARPSKKEIDA